MESEFYERLEEMLELASKEATGLQGLKAFKSDDGELVYVIEWDDEESLSAWRNHPVHRIAVAEGREKFYASYTIQICQEQRRSEFP